MKIEAQFSVIQGKQFGSDVKCKVKSKGKEVIR